MSLSKNLIPSDDAQTVRATGKGVIEIDLLPPKVVKNCRFLYVSYNSISNLQNITQFRFMQSLMIEYNLIETIEALYPLAQLTKLRTIRLEGNPVCFLPLWELQLIKICPQIVYINGMDVNTILKSKESRIKLDYLELERNFIQVIYLAEYVCRSIEIVLQHPEMSFTDSNNLVDLPPEEEFSQQVRKRCRNARPNQYMSQLKGIIIETHKRVQELSNSCPAIPKTSIRQHRKVLATASQKNSVPQFTEAVEPLSSAALFLVGIGDGVQLSPDDCMSVTSQMSRKSIVSTASTASTSSRARSVLKGVKKVNDAQKRRPSGSTANSQIKDEENINNNPNGEFGVDMNNTYNDDNRQHSDDDYDENDQKLNKNQNEGEEEEFNEDNINKHNSDINSNTNQQNSKNNKENIEMNQNEEEDNLDSVDENDQDKNHGNRNGINEEEENDDENTNKDNENLEEEEDYDDEVDDINGFQQKNDVNSKNSGSTGKNSQNEDGKLQSNAKNYGKNGLSDENDEDRDQSNNLSQKNKLNGNQTAGNGKNSGKNSYSDENDEEKENSFDNLQKNGLNRNKSATNGKNGSNGQGSDENQSDYNNSENDPNQSLEKEGKLDKNGQTNSNEYNSDDNLLKGAHSKQNQNEEEEDNLSGEENDQNIGNKRKSHYFDEEEDLYNDNPNYSKEDEINLDSNDHPKSSFHSFELEELRAQQEAEENDYEEEDFNFEEVEPPKYDGSKRNIRKYVDSAEQVTMPLLTSFTQTPSNIYNSRASQISQPTDNMASQTNTTPLKASDIRQIASVSDDDDNDKLFEIDDEIDNEEMKDNDEEIQKYNDLKNDALRLIQMSEEEETNQNINDLQKVTQNSEEEETNPKSKKYNKFNQNSDEEIPKSNKFNVYMNMSEEEDELNPKSKNYKNISQKQKNLSEEDDELNPKSKNYKNISQKQKNLSEEEDELNPKSKNYKNISQKQKNLSEEDDELNPKSKNYKNISQKQKNLSEEDDELNPKSKNYKNISQKQKNLSEEDDELNPKSKNYKNISQKQKNLSEEDDELNPKSKKFNGLQKVTQNSEKEKPKSKKYNKLSEEEDNVNPKSKSKIEQQNEEDINSISPQSSQIKEENEQKNTPENKSGKKVVLSDVSPQFRPSFAVGRSKNKKDIPKVNFDSDDLNNNKQLENEKSLQTSEFKNNEENSPNESDILFNAKGNKASPHTSDILFNDDIETKENNNEIEDVQINNVIDSLTPLNSDVLRQIEHLDPASNSSNDGDKKKDLSVVELAKTIEQKELTDSETKMSSNSFDGTDEDNKLLQEFASTEPLMNSAARFGEPSSPSSIKKDMNKPETNISLKSKKKVNIEKVDQKTKNDDEKMALSDIRNVTDGSNFDASLGTSDNGRRRPKSILKTSSTSPINKENTKRITFVPQNTSETMSGENYSGVEPVLILRNVVKNYDLMDKFFSKWKGEYKKRTQQMSSVISDIQTQAHSAIIEERKSKTISIMPINSIQSNFDTIKQIAIKHELIRKIDVQRDINEKLRERYEQAKRELAARQSSKPIPQSPMFNRSSVKQTRVDDDVINFAMSTRASVRQSTNTRVRTSLTTSGNPQGRITHMDILRLQMGM